MGEIAKLRKGTKVKILSLDMTEETAGLTIGAQNLIGKVLTIEAYTKGGRYKMKECVAKIHQDDFEVIPKDN